MTKLSPHAGEIAAMRSVSGATTYDEVKADEYRKFYGKSRPVQEPSHTAVAARRKRERANRKAGRRA